MTDVSSSVAPSHAVQERGDAEGQVSTPNQTVKVDRGPGRWMLIRALLGVIGVGVTVWLVVDKGVDALSDVLLPALPWLPLAAGLELLRIGMDALSTRYTLGRRDDAVPWLPLLGSHLVAFSVMGVAPAGRTTAEAVKAGLLARWIGPATAAATGAANQANTLLSSGAFSLFCALAAYFMTGWSWLTWGLLAHCGIVNLSGLAIRGASRYRKLAEWFGRRVPRLQEHIAKFHAASHETSLYPAKPVIAMMVGRAFQAGHFAVLAAAVGVTPTAAMALAMQGIYLLVAALGVAIPGQVGASEGGFEMASETIGIARLHGVSIALLAHAIQFALVGVGFVILALWPKRRDARPE